MLGAFLCLSQIAWTQQFEFFTARQGLGTAVQRAQQEGFADAQPFWIAYAGDLPVNFIRPRFDLATGRANYWIYALRSVQRDTTVFYAVVKLSFVGFQAMPLPGLPSPPGLLAQPLSSGWMDSDSLIVMLGQNQTYRDFRQNYPDSLPDLVTLGTGIMPGGTDLAVPLWVMMFSGSPQEPSTTMTCMAWRTSQGAESQCFSQPSGVGEEPVQGIQILPQPASEWVEVDLSEEWCKRVRKVQLLNLMGRSVYQWVPPLGLCRWRLSLPLTAGLYFLQVEAEGMLGRLPLVVFP